MAARPAVPPESSANWSDTDEAARSPTTKPPATTHLAAHGRGPRARTALSGDPIGINLSSNANYVHNPIWTDLHNLSAIAPWFPLSGTTVALTADGYPLADAKTWFDGVNYPAGTYAFSYTGTGTVSFSGAGQLDGPVTTSGGVTRAPSRWTRRPIPGTSS